MRPAHLHFFRRYRPDTRFKIGIRPLRRAKLAGPHAKVQGEQFERRLRFLRAVIGGDGPEKPAKGFGLDDGGAMLDNRRDECTFERASRAGMALPVATA
jgi:hypothetical protein